MNFNPQGQQSLLDLVAGLKAGMDPAAAYGIYSDIAGEQAQRIANRQQRLAGLSDLLSQTAMAGMPYSGAQALAEAQPGPAGPAVQNMLSSLYPTGQDNAPIPTNASGAPMDLVSSGSAPYAPGVPVTNAPQNLYGQGAGAVSPAFQPQPLSPTEQLAAQEAATSQAQQQSLQALAVDASARASQGQTMQEFLMDAAKFYPELFATPEGIKAVQGIALTVFQAPTV